MKYPCLILASTLLIATGFCLISTWQLLFDCVLSLKCNPILFSNWKIPKRARAEFYFFNWTNPEEVREAKPKLVEVGPYTFSQHEEKCNEVWNENGTVTFQIKKSWYYEESRNLKEKITSLDPTLIGIGYMTRNWNYFSRKLLFLSLSPFFSKLYGTHPVRELLFDGYPQKLIKVASATPFFAHLKIPSWDRFAWMYKRNGSADYEGTLNMGTGRNRDLGKIYQWNYQNRTEYYQDECGRVSGYSGQFLPRKLSKDTITVYLTDLLRPLSMKYAFTKRVNTILGYTYVASTHTFDNGTENPKNWCFCTGECYPSGLANVSMIRNGSPFFFSVPHFHGADPSYLERVEGLKPDPPKHELFVTVEPLTGIPLEIDVKLQMNILMQPIDGISLFENVPKMYFPVLWIRQTSKIRPIDAFLLKAVLIVNDLYIAIGVALIVIPVLFLCLAYFVRKKNLRFSTRIYESIPLKNGK